MTGVASGLAKSRHHAFSSAELTAQLTVDRSFGERICLAHRMKGSRYVHAVPKRRAFDHRMRKTPWRIRARTSPLCLLQAMRLFRAAHTKFTAVTDCKIRFRAVRIGCFRDSAACRP
jgi:hypothetical protein